MKIRKRPKVSAGFDLSPMLDVIFQLILFFLVSTTFASLPGINVNLPTSTTAQSSDATGVTVTVLDDGTMFFNDQESSMTLLDSQLAQIELGGRTKAEYPVTLNADDGVTNGTLVKVFDALRKNGFSSVSLRTTSKAQ